MSSPQQSNISSSPARSLRIDLAQPHPRRGSTVSGVSPYDVSERTSGGDPQQQQQLPRRSPTLVRSADPNDPEARERQRSLDADSAMQLSRARSGSVAILHGNAVASANGGLVGGSLVGSPVSGGEPFLPHSLPHSLSPHGRNSPSPRIDQDAIDSFPFLPSDHGHFGENEHRHVDDGLGLGMGLGGGMDNHLNQAHDPNLLAAALGPHSTQHSSVEHDALGGLPLYQATASRSTFDFNEMESFITEEKKKLGIQSPPLPRRPLPGASTFSSRLTSTSATSKGVDERAITTSGEPAAQTSVQISSELPVLPETPGSSNDVAPDTSSARLRQRKLSASNTSRPRTRRQGGKLALFEGSSGAPPPSLGVPGTNPLGRFSPMPSFEHTRSGAEEGFSGVSGSAALPPLYAPSNTGHDRPYRFSFYSNALSMTIHSRSLSELPSEGQTFTDLFMGRKPGSDGADKPGMGEFASYRPSRDVTPDEDIGAWWLDVMCPTDEEMKVLSKVRWSQIAAGLNY